MANTKLPNLLVLRCDTATGFYQVGWDSDMPIGRFTLGEVICETTSSEPISSTSAYYERYMTACRQACELNAPIMTQQTNSALEAGWFSVPLDLHRSQQEITADPFGSLLTYAMQTRYRLCAHKKWVWCAIKNGLVVDIRACEPPRKMEPVEFHVWQHQQQQQMQQIGNEILRGTLIAQESGLWFCPAT